MNHGNHQNHGKLIYESETFAIQGAIFDVYKEMGSGFFKPVYIECLSRELTLRRIPFVCQKPIGITYKGESLISHYIPDFICFGKILVELITAKEIMPEHQARMLNYLKVTSLNLGIIANLGAHPKATIKRMIKTNP